MIRIIAILVFFASAAWAVNPDEMLSDPVLEERAQALDLQLRCVKCRSEVIASSNADWARDARILVRELIAEGKSDEEVLTFFIDRYGDYVIMKPRFAGSGAVLWLTGPAFLVFGLLAAFVFIRKRRPRDVAQTSAKDLSAAEEQRLSDLLNE